MQLLSQIVEAVGPGSILFAIVLLLAGPFFVHQLFIATMCVQLEKLHDRGSVDVGRRLMRHWMAIHQGRAFYKWKAHWYEANSIAAKAINKRKVLHEAEMVSVLVRWKNLELLSAWNAWCSFVRTVIEYRLLRSEISSQQTTGNARAGLSLLRSRDRREERLRPELSFKQNILEGLTILAKSEWLEKFVSAMVVGTVVLMSMQGSCDSTLGRILGCSSEDRSKYMIFTTVLEALLLTVTCVFALEALLKIGTLGILHYLRSSGNLFDLVLALVALTEVVTVGTQLSCQVDAISSGLTTGDDANVCKGSGNSVAQILRALRLVRLSRLLRRFPSVRRVGVCFYYVLSESWGALALYALCVVIGTLMGFILLGGKIYDTRLPGGSIEALDWSAAYLPAKTKAHSFEEASFVMPNARVLLHVPGRETMDGLPGWPAQVDIAPVLSPTRGGYVEYAKTVLGFVEAPEIIVDRTGNLINISTLESFVRESIVDQTIVSLKDGAQSVLPHISAVIPEGVNFETMTEALFCVSQLAVGTGWAPIYARVRLALGYVGDVWALGFLFITRAVLASLFTALFCVHLSVMTAKIASEEKRLERESNMQMKFFKITGLWTVYYQVSVAQVDLSVLCFHCIRETQH